MQITAKALGMLPYGKVDSDIINKLEWIEVNERGNEVWWLTGHNAKTNDNCGRPRYGGCPDSENHAAFTTLDGVNVPAGQQYVYVGKKSCFKATCPECYESWSWREAKRIEHRLAHYRGRRNRVIHCAASVPRQLWHIDVEKMRKLSNRIAKKAGFEGGCVVYHPFREACFICGEPKTPKAKRCHWCGSNVFRWHYSPHFHYLGFGWIFEGNKVDDEIVKSGWVFINFGVRESVFGTAIYELSHCGVDYSGKGKHSVRWIGSMAYRALHVPKMEKEVRTCPICGSDIIPYEYRGVDLDLEH